MKKILFKDEEVQVLSKDHRIKYIDNYSVRFTLEFRQKLYDICDNDFAIDNIRINIMRLGINFSFNWKTLHGISKNFKLRRPCGASNEKMYLVKNQNVKVDKTYDEYLLSLGIFEKSKRGIRPTLDFMEDIYSFYPEVPIEKYLSNLGIDLNRFGYQRIYKIQKEIESPTPKEIYFDNDQINYLKTHPFVKRVNAHQLSLTDNFYYETQNFKHLHIDHILKIFEINPYWINYSRKNKIKYEINNFKPLFLTPVNDNLNLLIKIEKNKIKALNELVENNFNIIKSNLKKCKCSERKYFCNMIKEISKLNGNIYTTRELLTKVGISKTSYYSIIKNENYGTYEERKNQLDLIEKYKIETVVSSSKYPKGNRMIYMLLNKSGNHMSRNKIYRLCKKFDISCKVRKSNNSRQVANDLLKRNCKQNLLKRKFKLSKPGDIILTDVSYLKCEFGTVYLSAIKDACTGVVKLITSEKNDLTLALDTLDGLPKNESNNAKIFHSDQGALYLSDMFQNKLKELGYTQSMSKRGNCWDNAPQESFFGHLKDEVEFKKIASYEDLIKEIKEYEYYYNNQRPQWNRNMMTPIEYEKYMNSLTEDEYKEYYNKELLKYEEMMENAKLKAIKRAKDIGIPN